MGYKITLLFLFSFFAAQISAQEKWQSDLVKIKADGSLSYTPDSLGNIIPDFSRVGYYRGDEAIPDVAVVKTISPTGENDGELIQTAIDELSKKELNKDGFRGAILLKKGI